jgi:hypothetical protein
VSAAAEVLERARAAGVRLKARGDRLAYDAPADISSDLLVQLRECKIEILHLLRRSGHELLDLPADPKARTLRLTALIGILSPSRVPHRWPAAAWLQFIADAESFCRDWATEACLQDWPTWELFGCHRRAPWQRLDAMGLALLLRGKDLVALTGGEAVIRTATGAHQTYRCKPRDPLQPAERCLVWELGGGWERASGRFSEELNGR